MYSLGKPHGPARQVHNLLNYIKGLFKFAPTHINFVSPNGKELNAV